MAKNLLKTAAQDNTAAAAAVAPKKARKPRAAKKDTVVMEHAMTIEPVSSGLIPTSDGSDLDALLADLGLPSDEVIEPAIETDAEPVVLEASLPSTEDLEAAVIGAETAELMSAAASEEGNDGSAPTGTASELVGETAAAGAEKKAPTPRVRYTDKVERLKARVGDQLAEYSVLTTAEVPMDDAALNEVMERTMDIIRAMNKKVGNRGVGFIEWLSGKKTSLNNVLERTLRLLKDDGYLQTGDEGNLMKNLLARPYSQASARAMGGNTVVMFKELKVILPVEGNKGRFVANPDSLLLAKAMSMLAGAPAADTAPTEAAAGDTDADAEPAELATTSVEEAAAPTTAAVEDALF